MASVEGYEVAVPAGSPAARASSGVAFFHVGSDLVVVGSVPADVADIACEAGDATSA